jgi:myosin heavy subunit
MQQLECSGLMTALIISRESFPNKLPYGFILDRYSCLMLEKDFKDIGGMELKAKVNHILSKWLKPLSKKSRGGTRKMPFACGKTKVFFKAGAQDRLEELRIGYFEGSALTIQTWARKYAAMQMLTRTKRSVRTIQSFCRMVIERAKFQRQRRAATLVAAWIRGRWCVAQFVSTKRSVRKMQSFSRMVAARAKFQRQRRAATLVAAWSRGRWCVAQFVSSKRSVRKMQSFSRMVAARAKFQRQRRAATLMAAWSRGRWCVAQFVSTKRSVRKMQSFSRMVIEREMFQRQRRAATLVAAWIRGRLAGALLVQIRRERAAIVIQAQCRGWPLKLEFQRKRDATFVIQRGAPLALTEQHKMDNKLTGLTDEIKTVQIRADEKTTKFHSGVDE